MDDNRCSDPLLGALYQYQEYIPLDSVRAIECSVKHNESGIALEILVEQLYEYDVLVTSDALKQLYDVEDWMGIEVSTLKLLSTSNYVNLVGDDRRHYILDGEVISKPNGSTAYGGGHRPGTGYPNKSEFPQEWADHNILVAISDVATNPTVASAPGWTASDVWVRGTREGVDIEVLIRDGEIWTGYPTNLPRNPACKEITTVILTEEQKRLMREHWNRSKVLVEEANQYLDEDSLSIVNSCLFGGGETVEGLYQLLWTIAGEGVRVPRSYINRIVDEIDGFYGPDDLPSNLYDHAIGEPGSENDSDVA